MKTTNVKVKLNKLGSFVIKEGVTPAEVLLLAAQFTREVGDRAVFPVSLVKREKLPNAPKNLEDQWFWKETPDGRWEETEIEREDNEEWERLNSRYQQVLVKAAFPDEVNLRFPTDFNAAMQAAGRVKNNGSDTFTQGQICTLTLP